MQLRAAERLYGLLHEDAPYHDGSFVRWAKKPSREYPFHYLDGVSIWIAPEDSNPDDDFLSSVSQQAPGNEDQSAE